MTNYGQVENAVTTMQLGAINYLCKPVQPDNLLALITEILDKNDNEQEFYRGESPKAHEMYRLIQGRRIIFFTILQLVFYFYIIDY